MPVDKNGIFFLKHSLPPEKPLTRVEKDKLIKGEAVIPTVVAEFTKQEPEPGKTKQNLKTFCE